MIIGYVFVYIITRAYTDSKEECKSVFYQSTGGGSNE